MIDLYRMRATEKFEMRDVVGREALEEHPVWAPFKGDEDREMILGWGVTAERLDSEIDRFEYCGTDPMFPVLEFESLPKIGGMVIAATFEVGSGRKLCGYLIGTNAFGVFAEQREFSFNRNLPEAGAFSARRLGEALEMESRDLFPIRYRTGFRSADGREIEGTLEPFWD